MRKIRIGQRDIGDGQASFVIAEVAQAHDGSLGYAHSFIDAAAESGADAIKFQTHIASAESSKDEKFRIQMSGQDATRYDYWKRMEFTPEQWEALARHAKEKDLVFLSSPFSLEAVTILEKTGVPAWKVGSGEFRSKELMQAMTKTGKPILFSTGMSTYEEVSSVVDWFRLEKTDFALFQCTTNYPTKLEDVGINVIDEYKKKFDCVVGLSDHSGTPYPALAAMARGADLIEVHVTFDKRMYGPDTIASVTFDELNLICRSRDAFHVMSSNPVNKDDMADRLQGMRDLFMKSIALKESMTSGTVLEDSMLVPKKPGTGIPYTDKNAVIGKILVRDVPADRLLTWEDFEDVA